jgi:cell division protease FtsH
VWALVGLIILLLLIIMGVDPDNPPSVGQVGSFLAALLPALVVVGFLWLLMRRTTVTTNTQIETLKRAPVTEQHAFSAATFASVVGQAAAKARLAGVIALLKKPVMPFTPETLLPSGILITGAPGTGKSLLAQAVAGEAGVTLLHTHGAEFIELFIGNGSSRVRDLFARARKAAPCVIIIDDVDAIGSVRNPSSGKGEDERTLTLTQLFHELDQRSQNSGVLVIATTNRPDLLDEALTRSGRLEQRITLELPDAAEREQLLRKFASSHALKLDADVNLAALAAQTDGLSGAALEQLMREAALRAAGNPHKGVSWEDVLRARDMVN